MKKAYTRWSLKTEPVLRLRVYAEKRQKLLNLRSAVFCFSCHSLKMSIGCIWPQRWYEVGRGRREWVRMERTGCRHPHTGHHPPRSRSCMHSRQCLLSIRWRGCAIMVKNTFSPKSHSPGRSACALSKQGKSWECVQGSLTFSCLPKVFLIPGKCYLCCKHRLAHRWLILFNFLHSDTFGTLWNLSIPTVQLCGCQLCSEFYTHHRRQILEHFHHLESPTAHHQSVHVSPGPGGY